MTMQTIAMSDTPTAPCGHPIACAVEEISGTYCALCAAQEDYLETAKVVVEQKAELERLRERRDEYLNHWHSVTNLAQERQNEIERLRERIKELERKLELRP